jgi:carboxyl-terminal processing protease
MIFDSKRKMMLTVSGLLVAFVLLGGVLGRSLAVEGTYSYLKLFNEVLYLVRNNYVETTDDQILMEGAYRGMLENLDPLGEYLTAAEFRRASRDERNGPADVGLVLSKRRGYAIVVSALEGAPGEKAGVATGDQILTIDRRSTRNLGVWEATQALQGKAGTRVQISIIREEDSQRKDIDLIRRVPGLTPLNYRLLEAGYGLFRLGGLRSGDAERVRKGLMALRRQGADHLLLDLRSSSGSDLEEAVKVAGLFTGGARVVTVADRLAGNRDYRAPAGAPAWTGALVLLVNGGTSGAVEILAAALRDEARGALVGERTWGFGSVQRVIPLPGGDGIRLSVGKFLSPGGKEWNGVGLNPDVVQAASSEAPGKDLQMEKGLQLLKQGTGARKAA